MLGIFHAGIGFTFILACLVISTLIDSLALPAIFLWLGGINLFLAFMYWSKP